MPRSNIQDAGKSVSYLINDTGANSVKGSLIGHAAALDEGFDLLAADDTDGFGYVDEDGVPDGERCRIVTQGLCWVLLENAVASTIGGWMRSSTTVAGRTTANNALPTPPANTNHFFETGHCVEANGGGTDQVVRGMAHFN